MRAPASRCFSLPRKASAAERTNQLLVGLGQVMVVLKKVPGIRAGIHGARAGARQC